jgi:hypothetical protein
VPVEQRQVKRHALVTGLLKRVPGSVCAAHGVAFDPPVEEQARDHFAIGGVVIDHEYFLALQLMQLRQGQVVVGSGEGQFEPEDGALAHGAGSADAPAHDVHELAADNQAQARTPEAARGTAVFLDESLENRFELVFGDTDARVTYFKAVVQGRAPVFAGNVNGRPRRTR